MQWPIYYLHQMRKKKKKKETVLNADATCVCIKKIAQLLIQSLLGMHVSPGNRPHVIIQLAIREDSSRELLKCSQNANTGLIVLSISVHVFRIKQQILFQSK